MKPNNILQVEIDSHLAHSDILKTVMAKQKTSRYVKVHQDRCIGCGFCVFRCYFEVFEMNHKSLIVKKDNCFGCGLCVSVCSTGALELVKREKYFGMSHVQQEITDAIKAYNL